MMTIWPKHVVKIIM